MDKIDKAIVYLLQHDGTFYAEFFIQARRREGELPPNALMGVDIENGRIYLYTDKDLIEGFSIEQVAGILQHEALHIILEHPARRNNRNMRKYNIAGDLAINSMIKIMETIDGICIPGKHPFTDLIKGMTAEEYYDLLPDNNEMDGDGGASREIKDEFTKEVYRKAVEEAYKNSKGRGHIPSEIDQLIQNFISPPKINWRILLRQYVAASIKANNFSTWRRENRKGINIKGKMKDRILQLALAIDTSGSIFSDPKLLQDFYNEVAGIQRAYKSEIQIIECDAEVQKAYILKPNKHPNTKLTGGGGTSFKPPFRWLAENKKKVDVLIYLTDLYGDFPEKEYVRTIWAVCSDETKVPFGRVVSIK